MPTAKPKKVYLRSYQVGFGDCFLLTIEYSDGTKKFVLIDFGTTELPSSVKTSKPVWMKKIAEHIKETCKGNLDVIVATHRHADHISGFATDKEGKGAGKVIADCNPKLVIQPWTENPQLPETAKNSLNALVSEKEVKSFAAHSYAVSLNNMQSISENIVKEVQNLGNTQKYKQVIKPALKEKIEFIGIDNVSNKSAVKNLGQMGEKNVYINYGYDLNADIKDILPNIKVKVLGPPTIEQYGEVTTQSSKNPEFWMLQAMSKNFWEMQSATSELSGKLIDDEEKLFPNANPYRNTVPPHNRWFVRQIRKIRAEQLLSIATTMDNALNNTSLILLFEIGDKKFLFPGDAQIENWEYCLKVAKDKKSNLNLLQETDVYKVGHHGSRNATPRTLWETFTKKKEKKSDNAPNVMKSVISTMGDKAEGFKHGDPASKTEVPRESLVTALDNQTDYHTTQEIHNLEKPWSEIEIAV